MKTNYLTFLFLVSFCFGFAQTKDSLSVEELQRREKNIQAGNPFKKFGYKPKIATLSKGKYLEFHDLDSIVKIGSFSYHVKNKSITGYSQEETKYSEATLSPEIISRWFSPDRLSEEYPSWSPYTFTANNPIYFIDPDGDSLVVNGASSAMTKFESMSNKALGGYYTLGKSSTGKYILNRTAKDISNISPQQKAFTNTLNESATSVGDVSFDLVEHSDSASSNVFVGDNGGSSISANPGQHVIDIDDVNSFGDSGLLTSQGALGHEIKEGFEMQQGTGGIKQSGYDAHFNFAIPTENQINGNTSLGAKLNSSGNIEVNVVKISPQGILMPKIEVKMVELKFINGNLSPSGVINNN